MLSKEEIQKLFEFTRKKYVRYIDVQVELVDHLASAIEELRTQDSDLSFESTLQKVYAKFPITGFNDLIQEKTKALNYFWFKKLKTYLITFLTWPKILWFILAFTGFYTLSTIVYSNVFFIVTLVVSILFLVCTRINPVFRKEKMNKYLSLTTYYGFCVLAFLFPTQMMIQCVTPNTIMLTGYLQIVVCGMSSVYLLILYALFVVFPEQIKEDVLGKYEDLIPSST